MFATMKAFSGGRKLFLRWALVNAVYLAVLVAGRLSFHGHIPAVGLVAIGAVLLTYVLASAWAGWLCWQEDKRGVHHVSLAIELAPKLAMLGTISGFLLAFGAQTGDVATRVLGASSALSATWVGVSSMIVLEVIRHIVEND